MKKQIYDEKNGLNYTLHGDYYLPDLEINEEEPTYGKYGIMRKQFFEGTQECQVSISGTDREIDGAFESGRQRSKRKS